MIFIKNSFPQLFLRMALSFSMLSAVADRLGFWSENAVWGNWDVFVKYTRTLTIFLPNFLSEFGAYAATFFEILFSILLLIGFKVRLAAFGTTFILLSFGISMTITFGVKSTFDYSVWTSVAAALLLAIQSEYQFSIDNLILKNKI